MGRAARLLLGGWVVVVPACSDEEGDAPATAIPVSADRCLVRLHGKGDTGAPTTLSGGVAEITPAGNAEGWGGRQWLYFPDAVYAEAREVVAGAIDEVGCDRVVLNGFSNGGGFAGKLYCRGDTFGDRLVGVVLDDPVPDAGSADCDPAPDIPLALYWTSAQDPISQPGFDCDTLDGTCEGGVTVGIDAYAAALGAEVQPSPFSEHEWYREAPELATWLDPAAS